MVGKLIVIEGTDCSGKETQSKLLVDFLNKKGVKAIRFAFPNYNSPTGKIIAGPYLGKEGFLPPVFDEGSVNVEPYCACLLYAMDRRYNIGAINEKLSQGYVVVLDRYVESNMAFQGARIQDRKDRVKLYDFIDKLEYNMLELPRSNKTIFLHMPAWASAILKRGRAEKLDQNEVDEEYLKRTEKVYFELADMYNWKTISCISDNNIKTPVQINNMLCEYVMELIDEKCACDSVIDKK